MRYNGEILGSASLLSDHRSSDLGKQITVGAPGLPGAVRNRQASRMAAEVALAQKQGTASVTPVLVWGPAGV